MAFVMFLICCSFRSIGSTKIFSKLIRFCFISVSCMDQCSLQLVVCLVLYYCKSLLSSISPSTTGSSCFCTLTFILNCAWVVDSSGVFDYYW